MAIYHFHAKMVTRSAGSSAAGAAAYASAENLKDHLGKTHDYSDKKDVVYKEMLLPVNAPAWMKDRELLWQAVERREDQSTRPESAQLLRQVEMALPRELSRSEQIVLAREFAVEQFVERGMVADLNLHAPVSWRDGEIQPHAHVLLTLRGIEPDGSFGNKEREWGNREQLLSWREAWAEHVNHALEKAGVAERVDYRTLEAQGIDRMPEPKIGAAVQAMEQRGIVTERGEQFREVQAFNAAKVQEAASSKHIEPQAGKGMEQGRQHHAPSVEQESGNHSGHGPAHEAMAAEVGE